MSARKSERDSRRLAGCIGLGVGLSMAIAANLVYGIPRGPVVAGVGLVCPLVLPLALWLRSTLPLPGPGAWAFFSRRLPLEIATVMVAGPAAATSYAHTYSLLLHHDPEWAMIAVVAPFSADGLAAISVMVLRSAPLTRSAPPTSRPRYTPRTGAGLPPKVAPKPTPRPEARPAAIEPAPPMESATLSAQIANWLASHRAERARLGKAQQTPAEENQEIRAVFQCSEVTIKRARRRLRELEAELSEASR